MKKPVPRMFRSPTHRRPLDGAATPLLLMRPLVVFVVYAYGPPRVGDLNFTSRVYGKPPLLALSALRAVPPRDAAHVFRLRASSWFWRGWPAGYLS